jgi:hypothetical protein
VTGTSHRAPHLRYLAYHARDRNDLEPTANLDAHDARKLHHAGEDQLRIFLTDYLEDPSSFATPIALEVQQKPA